MEMNGQTISLASSVSMKGDLRILQGSLDVSGSDYKVTVGSSWMNTGGSFVSQSGTVEFDGEGKIRANSDIFYNVVLDGETLTLADTMNVRKDLKILKGDLDVSSGSYKVIIGNSWMNTGGSFVSQSGTVEFDGEGKIRANNQEFNDVEMNGQTISLASSVSMKGDLRILQGSLDVSGSDYKVTVGSSWMNTGGSFVSQSGTVEFDGEGKIRANSDIFHSVVFDGQILTLADTMNVRKDLNILKGGLDVSSGSYKVIIGNSWMNTGGSFVSQSGTVEFDGEGKIRANNQEFNDVEMNGQTISLASSVSMKGDLRILQGSLDVSGSDYKVTVGRSWMNSGGSFVSQSGTVEFDGEGKIRANSDIFHSVVLDGQTLTLADTMNVRKDLKILKGALDVSDSDYKVTVGSSWMNVGGNFVSQSGTVEFDGAGKIRANNKKFNDMEMNGQTISLASSVNMKGDLRMLQGSLDVSAGDYKVTVGRSWMNSGGSFVSQSGTVEFDGEGKIRADSDVFYSVVLDGQILTLADTMNVRKDLKILKGGLDVSSGSYKVIIGNSWMNSGGSFVSQSGTVEFDGAGKIRTNNQEFNDMEMNGQTISLASSVRMKGDLRILQGSLDVSGSDYKVTLGKSWMNSGGSFVSQSGTVEFDGEGKIRANNQKFNDMSMNGQTISLASSVRMKGDLRMLQGSLDVSGSDYKVTVGRSWMNSGGSFVSQSGTVEFDGVGKIRADSDVFYNVVLDGETLTLADTMNVRKDLKILKGALDVSDSDYKVTVGSSWVNKGGSFVSQSGTVEFDGAGKIRANNKKFNDMEMNGQTISLASSVNMKGDLRMLQGSLDVSAGDYKVTVGRSWMNSGGSFVSQSGTVEFDGSGKIRADSDVFYSVVLDGQTLTLADTMNVRKDLKILKGALDVSDSDYKVTVGSSWMNVGGSFVSQSGTVEFDGAGKIRANNQEFNDMSMNGQTISLASSVRMKGDLRMLQGALDVSDSDYKVTVGRSWMNSGGSFVSQSGTVEFDGEGKIRADSDVFYSVVLDGQILTLADTMNVRKDLKILKGALDVSSNNYKVIIGNSWMNSGGSFVSQSGTVEFDGVGKIRTNNQEFNDMSMNGQTISLASSLRMKGDLRILQGSLDVSAGDYKVTLGKSWMNSGGSFVSQSGTVEFDGEGKIRANNQKFNDMEMNGQTISLASSVNMKGDLRILQGSLDVSAGDYKVTVGRSWMNSGGSFVSQSGTVEFDGEGKIRANNQEFNDMSMNGQTIGLASSVRMKGDLRMLQGLLDVSAGDYKVTVGKSWMNSGGSFVSQSGTVEFDGAGKIRANSDIFYDVVLDGETLILADTMNVRKDLKILKGALDVSSSNYKVIIGNSWMNTGGSFVSQGGTVEFDGDGKIRANNQEFNDMAMNGQTISLASSVRMKGDLRILQGSLDVSAGDYKVTVGKSWMNSGGSFVSQSGTVEFDGEGKIRANNQKFNDMSMNGQTISLASSVRMKGDLRILQGSLNVSGSDYKVTVGRSWMNSGGSFVSQSGTVEFDGVGKIRADSDVFYSVVLDGETLTLGDTMNVRKDLKILKGALDVSSSNYKVIIGNSWMNSGGSFVSQSGTVEFDGAGKIRANNQEFNDMSMNGQTISLASSVRMKGDLRMLQGSLDVSAGDYKVTVGRSWMNSGGSFVSQSGTVEFDGVGKIRADSDVFYSVVLDGETLTLGDTMNVRKDLKILKGALDVSNSNYKVIIGNSWMNSGGSFVSQSGTVEFDGAGKIRTNNQEFNDMEMNGQTISLASSVRMKGDLRILQGSLDVSGSDYKVTLGRSWMNSGGSFVSQSGTVEFDGEGKIRANNQKFNDMSMNGQTISLASSVRMKGDLRILQGSLNVSGSDYKVTVGRSWMNSGGSFVSQSGTVEFDGVGKIRADSDVFYNVVLDGETLTLADTMNVRKDLKILKGALDVSDSDYKVTVGSSWVNKGGSFVSQSGTVEFDGAGKIRANNKKFNDMEMNGQTISLASSVNMKGDLRMLQGSLDVSAGDYKVTVGRSWMNSGGSFVSQSGTVEFDGSGKIRADSDVFYSVVLDGQTLTLADTMNVRKDLKILKGALDVSDSDYKVTVGSSWMNVGGSFVSQSGTVSRPIKLYRSTLRHKTSSYIHPRTPHRNLIITIRHIQCPL